MNSTLARTLMTSVHMKPGDVSRMSPDDHVSPEINASVGVRFLSNSDGHNEIATRYQYFSCIPGTDYLTLSSGVFASLELKTEENPEKSPLLLDGRSNIWCRCNLGPEALSQSALCVAQGNVHTNNTGLARASLEPKIGQLSNKRDCSVGTTQTTNE